MHDLVQLQDRIRNSIGGHIVLGKFMDNSSPPIGKPPKLYNPEPIFPKQFETFESDVPNIGQWEFASLQDPFSLTFNDFLSLNLDDAKDLLQRVSDLCKDELQGAWKKGLRQVVICDGKIILESKDPKDISNEIVEGLAKDHNKACYVFSAPDKVEESTWTPVIVDVDYYPTLCVYLGTENSNESAIVESSPIHADFDTGNPCYKIFDANQLKEPLSRFSAIELRRGSHLGREYDYFSKRAKICVKDENGRISSMVASIRLVSDWEGCALLQTSPNRVGFIGRDVLRELKLKIELDAERKVTRIVDISS